MNSSTILWLAVAVILIGGGAYYYMQSNNMGLAPQNTSPSDIDTGGSLLDDEEANESYSEAAAEGDISGTQAAAEQDTTVDADAQADATGSASANTGQTVRLTSAGFEPSTITVPVGTTVTWVNEGSAPMWVAADVHPTHTQYDDTSRNQHCTTGYAGPTPFDQCTDGATYSFTFDKAGTWRYHNHLNASQAGMVIVQ